MHLSMWRLPGIQVMTHVQLPATRCCSLAQYRAGVDWAWLGQDRLGFEFRWPALASQVPKDWAPTGSIPSPLKGPQGPAL